MAYLYHEQQLSALCGVHALNNLLQGPTFGAGDLAAIAHQLDEAERALLDPSERAAAAATSHRIDVNTGDFALEVLAKALDVVQAGGVALINVDHASVAEAVGTQPEAEEGFLVHRSSHWFALRRVASLWWHLDSKLPRPLLVTHEALGPFIARLRVDGHTVHVARSAAPLPLPQGEAAAGGAGHEAVYHPIDCAPTPPTPTPPTPPTPAPPAREWCVAPS
jgi:ataxin-3